MITFNVNGQQWQSEVAWDNNALTREVRRVIDPDRTKRLRVVITSTHVPVDNPVTPGLKREVFGTTATIYVDTVAAGTATRGV